jgi:hypothetical protein
MFHLDFSLVLHDLVQWSVADPVLAALLLHASILARAPKQISDLRGLLD